MSDKALEEAVKKDLGLSQLKSTGISGEGCICSGSAYDTDKCGRVFIKVNSKAGARTMFDGEYASLDALYKANTVRVPKPIKVVDLPAGGSGFVMEYVEMGGGLSKHAATLGDQLARLHLQNPSRKEKNQKAAGIVHKDDYAQEYIGQFGFHVTTCCGFIEMDNTWKDDWPSFYAGRVETQIKLLETKNGDRQARELWNMIVPKLPRFFDGIHIEPALLHGDLWSGNVTENDEGPVIFDPASYYGHSEFDLSMGLLFGGFNSKYYTAYHKVIPKAPGFEERKTLYTAFHYVNHCVDGQPSFCGGLVPPFVITGLMQNGNTDSAILLNCKRIHSL